MVASKLEAAARLGCLRGASASGAAFGNGSAQGLSEMLGGGDRSPQRAGSVRLRDAIVWGYMMQRHGNRAKACHTAPSLCNCLGRLSVCSAPPAQTLGKA